MSTEKLGQSSWMPQMYREIAAGTFQTQVAEFGPVEYHPDYLGQQRRGINVAYRTQRHIPEIISIFDDNGDQPLGAGDFLEAIEDIRQEDVSPVEVSATLRELRWVGLLLAKETNGNDERRRFLYHLSPDARTLNHDMPLYRSDMLVKPAMAAGAIATGVLGVKNAPIMETIPLLLSSTGLGIMVTGSTVTAAQASRAVMARRYYRNLGF